MNREPPSHRTRQTRRTLLGALALAGAGSRLPAFAAGAAAPGETQVMLPFENGQRALVAYPQKRPLIVLTSRPPQLETPFAVFNDGLITPNDAFFVRYHWSAIPTSIDPATYRLRIAGKVNAALELSLAEIKALATSVDVVAVNQCSGNSRGFFTPRVNGGQLANGAMGNARWTGIPLKVLLDKAGVQAGALQVSFNGLDTPPLGDGPDFIKALDIDQARDGEVMVAWAMNGEDLPMLNGFPLRLVVPGHYGTYWVKHLSEITVLDTPFEGFWVKTGYRIPDTACACVEPGTAPKKTVPISRFNVRSFLTNVVEGDTLRAGQDTVLRGIAFDSGHGITEVAVSLDGGQTWQGARLGDSLGRYAFREWKALIRPASTGALQIKVRATNRIGQSQPLEALWNAAGYMRNVVETTRVNVV